jgi:hypothetical protein
MDGRARKVKQKGTARPALTAPEASAESLYPAAVECARFGRLPLTRVPLWPY